MMWGAPFHHAPGDNPYATPLAATGDADFDMFSKTLQSVYAADKASIKEFFEDEAKCTNSAIMEASECCMEKFQSMLMNCVPFSCSSQRKEAVQLLSKSCSNL
jgi:hypothetical protein